MSFAGGDTFDRYVIEVLLGEGGMGRVYRAHDTKLGRRVALKVVRFEDARALVATGLEPTVSHPSIEAAARLMREARAAAALDHPNAVVVFDVGKVGDVLYIAMEFVPGRTLRSYVGDATVPWDHKLRWLVDAARALAAAHDRGLVHRDVKPENVMVRDDGVVKVLDFGIAKHVTLDADAQKRLLRESQGRMLRSGEQLTAAAISDTLAAALNSRGETLAGAILGTPRYLSPEQVRGEPVDARADQFSWGVLAYELLTGRLPWDDQPIGVELMLAILNKAPPKPSTFLAQLPSAVEASLLRTLAKKPSDRFASMHHVVRAMESFAATMKRAPSERPPESYALQKTEPVAVLPTPAPPEALTSPPSRPRAAPTRSLRVALVGSIALVAVVSGVAVWSRARTQRAPPSTSTSGSTSAFAAKRSTTLLDLPPPETSVSAARSAYEGYLHAFREADWAAAHRALARAVELDPELGAAHLRLAFMDSLESANEADVRKTFHEAELRRDAMTERDRGLLDALAPYLQLDPSDPATAEARLGALVDRFADDAELAFFLGSVRFDRGRFTAARDALDHAVTLDPAFAEALATRAGVQAYLGDFDGAQRSLDACTAAAGAATECLWYLAQLDEQRGECAKMEADARRWTTKDPDDAIAYQWFAKALFAQGKSSDAVLAALEQKWARTGARRKKTELLDRARLAAATGEFAQAKAHLDALETLLADEPGALAHAEPTTILVEIAREAGDDTEARRVATSFLARKDAWVAPHRVDDRAIFEDPVPLLLGALLHTGGVTRAELETKRKTWLDAWSAKTSDAYFNYLWIYAYALPTETQDEAEAALAALPSFSPLPPFTPQSIASAHVGRVYFRAQRWSDALAPLAAAENNCAALAFPFASVRASWMLARTKEALEDVAGACRSYAKVVARWGKATPRSKTAQDAAKRAKALGCGG